LTPILTRGVGHFIYLENLESGDRVTVYAGEKAYSDSVLSKESVEPADVYMAHPKSDATLILPTCINRDAENRRCLERLVVVAKLVENG